MPDKFNPFTDYTYQELEAYYKGMLCLTDLQFRQILRLRRCLAEIWDMDCYDRTERLAMLKGMRKHFIRIATYQALIEIPRSSRKGVHGIEQDKETFRLVRFGRLEKGVESDDKMASAVLSMLGISRDIMLEPKIDLKPIEEPYNGTVDLLDWCRTNVTELNLKKTGLLHDPAEDWRYNIDIEPKWSIKSGPYGHAGLNGWFDVLMCPPMLGEQLVGFSANYLPVHSVGLNLTRLGQFRQTLPSLKQKDFVPRRLSAIADYEGKTRVIAIGDWTSQTVLRPIHNRLMAYLKNLKTDLTYYHHKLPGMVRSFTMARKTPYSVDLTAATDRLPAVVSASLLGVIWKDECLSKGGLDVMTGPAFAVPSRSAPTQKAVRYSVGQPMGLASSGPALAVTNHFLVRLAGLYSGLNKFSDYIVLGDDIVIFSKKVGTRYVKLMESLGVSTKPQDSIKPVKEYSCEVAKRLFRFGVEISPIPIRLYRRNRSLLFYYIVERGGDLSHLLTSYPGSASLEDLRSLSAASLLYMGQNLDDGEIFKTCPIWSDHTIERLLDNLKDYRKGNLSGCDSFPQPIDIIYMLLKGVVLASAKDVKRYDQFLKEEKIPIKKLTKTAMALARPTVKDNLQSSDRGDRCKAWASSEGTRRALRSETLSYALNDDHLRMRLDDLFVAPGMLVGILGQQIAVLSSDKFLDARDNVNQAVLNKIEQVFIALALSRSELVGILTLLNTNSVSE